MASDHGNETIYDDDGISISITDPPSVKFPVFAGVEYEIVVDGLDDSPGDSSGHVQLNLSFAPDITPPDVSISFPASNARLMSNSVDVRGTARDNVVVTNVEFRLENAAGTNAYQPALTISSWRTWDAMVTNLVPGLNTVRARAVDSVGNFSTAARSFTYVVTSPFTFMLSGEGVVSPNLNGDLLEIGKSYTITAKPAANNIFAYWSGDVASSNPRLTFTMISNMTVQANFITNVFIPVKGSYAGLFLSTNGVTPTNSGLLTVTLADKGSISGKLGLPSGTVSFSGPILWDGTFSNAITRSTAGPITVTGMVDLAGDTIIGQITIGSEVSDLLAYRSVFSKSNPSPFAGKKYTLMIPGSEDSSLGPGGFGFGAATLNNLGNITFTGTLGDGAKVTQKTFVAADGSWPFYAAPYSSKNGLIIGWLQFDTNNPDLGPVNALAWTRGTAPKSKVYPYGIAFNTLLETSSSLLTDAPTFSWTNGVAVLEGGNLSESIANPFTIGAKNKVTGPNNIKLAFKSASGTFKGSVINPATGKPINISGVILQSGDAGDAGYGVFSGTNQTGSVLLLPE